jgi:GR25 family glycosyltransferase involved in LPS biosynthesis
MIEKNLPYLVVFEDDVLPHLDLGKGLGEKIWNATPKDFDILYMGNMMNPEEPLMKNNSTDLVVRLPTYTTHAYIITQKGARKIIQLARELNAQGIPLKIMDMQLFDWQVEGKLDWYCWNGTMTPKSYPTFDGGLPWRMFPNVIIPNKDTGFFWQNMRFGTTLDKESLTFNY